MELDEQEQSIIESDFTFENKLNKTSGGVAKNKKKNNESFVTRNTDLQEYLEARS